MGNPLSFDEGSAPGPATERLLSLDVYRGLAVAGMILVDNPGDDAAAYAPIQHAEWNGWTPADLIFPSFLFLVGISVVFSFSRRLARREPRKEILVHAVRRTLILIAIGLFVNGFPVFHLADYRILGVLQRIAVCYLVSSLLVLWSGPRGQLTVFAACLAGYWALMRFVPVPGLGVPGRDIPFLDPDRNIVAWLDRSLFMGRLYNGTRDPEGVLSTIPAIATALGGVLTAGWLRSRRTAEMKAAGMVAVGVLGLVVGEIWSLWFPINKNLWTSSFVVFTEGFALVFLGLLYWALEIRRWRGGWTTLVLVFGMNAIAGFVADALVYGPAYSFHAMGANGTSVSWQQWLNERLVSLPSSPQNASLLYSLMAVLFCWTLLFVLYRKRIFIRI